MASIETIQLAGNVPLLLSPAEDLHARFSREAYHRLFEFGVLNSESRIELIDGEIFMMSPLGAPQGSYIGRLNDFFVRNLPEELHCRVQMPIIAGDHSEPEPDIAIVNRREDYYKNEHPSPADVALIIEVAQSSLTFDLGKKMALYATCNIREYWVVDVENRLLYVHRGHSGNRYVNVCALKAGGPSIVDELTPLAAPGCRLSVNWLFR